MRVSNLKSGAASYEHRGRHAVFAMLLIVGCALATSCAVHDERDDRATQAPPVVTPERTLSSAEAEALVDDALKEFGNDDNVQRLIAAVRNASTAPLTAGNAVQALVDGPQTFAAIEASVAAAQHHVHVETFIYDDDELGRRFGELLARKRAEGVEVRLLYDSVGSMETDPAFFDRLRDQGLEVREFRPINPAETPLIWKIQNRDHRKILVVDGKVAYTGGINVSATYSSASSTRPGPDRGIEDGWRDTHVRIEGPAVAQLQKLFFENWHRAADEESDGCGGPEYFPAVAASGNQLVTIVANDSDDSDDRSLYVTYLRAFEHAHSRLWITHAYFAPNDDLLEAMTDAAKRGVDVRLIAPGFTDSNVILYATRSTYTRLLKGGVKIYERKDALLHAKSVVVDGTLSIVGSANLDMRSFIHNDEANAIIISRDFGRRMEEIFERDVAASRPLDLDTWKQRSLWERMREFGSKLVWYWL